MRAYLSIDLDYWRLDSKTCDVKCFFRRVFELGLPICVALHHHHLLDDINDRRLDTLVNVDYHSDIVDEFVELSEGNWANFVQFKKHGTFVWRYPNKKCLNKDAGYCHDKKNPFTRKCSGWHHVKKKEGIARISWSKISAVGVCLSPAWLGDPSIVGEIIETLELMEWMGYWATYGNYSSFSKHKEAEEGTGRFAPYIIEP